MWAGVFCLLSLWVNATVLRDSLYPLPTATTVKASTTPVEPAEAPARRTGATPGLSVITTGIRIHIPTRCAPGCVRPAVGPGILTRIRQPVSAARVWIERLTGGCHETGITRCPDPMFAQVTRIIRVESVVQVWIRAVT